MRKYKGKDEIVIVTELIANKLNGGYFDDFVKESLERFRKGDWGTVEFSDAELNTDDEALGVYELYRTVDGEKIIDIIWIKRDFDGERYIVTVLFPKEY